MRSEGYGTVRECVCVYVCMCVCACVRACVRACVCLSVRLLPRFQRLRATTQRNSDTNGFIAKLASFCDFRITTAFRSYGEKANMLMYSLTVALLQRPLARCFDDRGI